MLYLHAAVVDNHVWERDVWVVTRHTTAWLQKQAVSKFPAHRIVETSFYKTSTVDLQSKDI